VAMAGWRRWIALGALAWTLAVVGPSMPAGPVPPALTTMVGVTIIVMSEVFALRRGALPRFDLILLGLGIDGHTGSLFPGSPALKEVFRPVVAVHAAAAAIPERITLTYPVLNNAANVLFLVSGSEKAKVVRAVLKDGALLPAGMVRPRDGHLTWMLDRPAAAQLGG